MQSELLQYWYEAELLRPSWPNVHAREFDLAKDGLPWRSAVRESCFDIYLGCIPCGELAARVAAKRDVMWEDAAQDEQQTCVCAFSVDDVGVYIAGSFVLAPLLWAYRRLLVDEAIDATTLADMIALEAQIDALLRTQNTIDSISALASTLERALKKLGVTSLPLRRPCYWARAKRTRGAVTGFGSECLRDLTRIVPADAAALTCFLDASLAAGISTAPEEREPDPACVPLGKWQDGTHLSLGRQRAVLSAWDSSTIGTIDCADEHGQIALIRALVAADVVERAALLAAYDRPEIALREQAAALTSHGVLIVCAGQEQAHQTAELLTNAACGVHSVLLGSSPCIAPQSEILPWEQARRAFESAYDETVDTRAAIERARAALEGQSPDEQSWQDAQHAVDAQKTICDETEQARAQAQAEVEHIERALQAQQDAVKTLQEEVPRSKKALSFLFRDDPTLTKVEEARAQERTLQTQLEDARATLAVRERACSDAQQAYAPLAAQAEAARTAWQRARDALAHDRAYFGAHYADSAYWQNATDESPCPWIAPAYDALRETLFARAVALLAAFVAECAPVREELRALEMAWAGEAGATADDATYGVLALTAPALVTSFAEVQHVLARVEAGRFGMAVLCGAGSVSPQMAAGALWRARRAVFVDAPVHAAPAWEPPTALAEHVVACDGIAGVYQSPDLSARMLADACDAPSHAICR